MFLLQPAQVILEQQEVIKLKRLNLPGKGVFFPVKLSKLPWQQDKGKLICQLNGKSAKVCSVGYIYPTAGGR